MGITSVILAKKAAQTASKQSVKESFLDGVGNHPCAQSIVRNCVLPETRQEKIFYHHYRGFWEGLFWPSIPWLVLLPKLGQAALGAGLAGTTLNPFLTGGLVAGSILWTGYHHLIGGKHLKALFELAKGK